MGHTGDIQGYIGYTRIYRVSGMIIKNHMENEHAGFERRLAPYPMRG